MYGKRQILKSIYSCGERPVNVSDGDAFLTDEEWMQPSRRSVYHIILVSQSTDIEVVVSLGMLGPVYPITRHLVHRTSKTSRSRFAHLQMFSVNVTSPSFVIFVNPLHP